MRTNLVRFFLFAVSLVRSLMSFSLRPKIRLVWHRRDLRLHDNWLYQKADAEDLNIVSVYIFNNEDFQPRSSSCREDWLAVNMGPFAAKLQIEGVRQLRKSLHKIGGDLIVRKGNIADTLSSLVEAIEPDEVRWNEEPGVYESQLSRQVWKSIDDNHTKITYGIKNHIKITTNN